MIAVARQDSLSKRGILVENPHMRLSRDELELIHRSSLALLEKPGILCYSEESTALLEQAGASVTAVREGGHDAWWVSIPSRMAHDALSTVPSTVVLGARDPDNKLTLNTEENYVHFGTGSETNYWLEIAPELFTSREDGHERVFPLGKRHRGNLDYLCRSAHLAENLENLDFFIRNVNIQDDDISLENKDVNVFFAALNNTTKHVMGGLVELKQLDPVVRMAELIAGGRDELLKNPVLSFITSVIKSPLQVVDDTARKLIAIARLGLPVVISSSPQGGSTAPIDEVGMVSQVNAEVLTGIIINQLARPGAPVIYGAVPVRARMEDLHDLYGVPELCHYSMACAQMARYYGVPCYSSAGVADARMPGIQATVEKMLTHMVVPSSAPGLVHYAFGLLDKTQAFCPEQAVLDDFQIGMAKFLYRGPQVTGEALKQTREMVNDIMHSPYRLYARHALSLLRSGGVFPGFPFAGGLEDQDETLLKAHARVGELMAAPRANLPEDICSSIFEQVPGILTRLNPYVV